MSNEIDPAFISRALTQLSVLPVHERNDLRNWNLWGRIAHPPIRNYLTVAYGQENLPLPPALDDSGAIRRLGRAQIDESVADTEYLIGGSHDYDPA